MNRFMRVRVDSFIAVETNIHGTRNIHHTLKHDSEYTRTHINNKIKITVKRERIIVMNMHVEGLETSSHR